MTLKAMRALAQADMVVHFAKNGSASHARTIAASHLRPGRRGVAAPLSGHHRERRATAASIAMRCAPSTTPQPPRSPHSSMSAAPSR